MNAVGGADGGAHHAGDAFDASGAVAVESMHTSEVGGLYSALFGGIVLSALFGVLKGSAGASLSEGGEEMPHRCAKSLDDTRDIHGLGGGHWGRGDRDDVFFFDGHINRV